MTDLSRLLSRLAKRSWFALAAMSAGVAVVVVAVVQGKTVAPPVPQDQLQPWAALVVVAGVVVFAMGALVLDRAIAQRRYAGGDKQISNERLKRSLYEAQRAIAALRREVEEREQALGELERSIETNRELAKLSEPEASAVRHVVRSEFHRSSRRSLIRDLVLVLLGAGLTWLIGELAGS